MRANLVVTYLCAVSLCHGLGPNTVSAFESSQYRNLSLEGVLVEEKLQIRHRKLGHGKDTSSGDAAIIPIPPLGGSTLPNKSTPQAQTAGAAVTSDGNTALPTPAGGFSPDAIASSLPISPNQSPSQGQTTGAAGETCVCNCLCHQQPVITTVMSPEPQATVASGSPKSSTPAAPVADTSTTALPAIVPLPQSNNMSPGNGTPCTQGSGNVSSTSVPSPGSAAPSLSNGPGAGVSAQPSNSTLETTIASPAPESTVLQNTVQSAPETTSQAAPSDPTLSPVSFTVLTSTFTGSLTASAPGVSSPSSSAPSAVAVMQDTTIDSSALSFHSALTVRLGG